MVVVVLIVVVVVVVVVIVMVVVFVGVVGVVVVVVVAMVFVVVVCVVVVVVGSRGSGGNGLYKPSFLGAPASFTKLTPVKTVLQRISVNKNHAFLLSNADLRGRLLKNALFLNIRLRRVMFILLKNELFVEAKNKVLKKL